MNASLERVLTASPHTADATVGPLTAENATVTRSDAAQTPTTLGRISREALPSASELREQLPVDADLAGQIRQHRDEINAILAGDDDRLLVVVGPCSIHDLKAARDVGAPQTQRDRPRIPQQERPADRRFDRSR